MFEHEASLELKHKIPLLKYNSLCHFQVFNGISALLSKPQEARTFDNFGELSRNAVYIMRC